MASGIMRMLSGSSLPGQRMLSSYLILAFTAPNAFFHSHLVSIDLSAPASNNNFTTSASLLNAAMHDAVRPSASCSLRSTLLFLLSLSTNWTRPRKSPRSRIPWVSSESDTNVYNKGRQVLNLQRLVVCIFEVAPASTSACIMGKSPCLAALKRVSPSLSGELDRITSTSTWSYSHYLFLNTH